MAEPYTDVDNYDLHRQLAIYDVLNPNSHSVANSVTSSPHPVPDGWIIQQIPRFDGSRMDTYYIEPDTGRRFRSRYEITRYLNHEEYKAYSSRPSKLKLRIKKSGDRMTITRAESTTPESKQIICAEKMTPESKQIICAEKTPKSKWITTNFTLPENWYVQRVPRTSGKVDKFYNDPETGRKFRSLKDVEKYLTEGTIPTRSRSKRRNSKNYHKRQFPKNNKCKMNACSGKMLDFNEDNNKDNAYQLATVAPTSSQFASSFKLPDGWVIEAVPRKSNEKHIDRYYHDPETGRKFRSLKDVQRYLTEGTIPTGSRSKGRNSLNCHERQLQKNNNRKMISCSGKMLDFNDGDEDKDNATHPTSSRLSSSFNLPDGWIIEEVPRRSNEKHIDRYYYEPGTQKKFRSLTAVQRHIAEHEENSSLLPLQEHKENNLPLSKNHGSYDFSKKTISSKEQCSSSNSLPTKINWIIPNTIGETWNPFVGDTPIPDSMKQQWGRRFNINHNVPISGCTGMNPS